MYPTDVPRALHGQRILIVHGSQDRIASPSRSASLARNLAAHADVGYVTVLGAKHAMLRRHEVFDTLAARFAATTLLGTAPTGVLAEIAAGRRWVQV